MSPLRYHIPLISCARNRSPSSHSLQFLLARRSELRAQCSYFISDNSCNCPACSVFCCSVCPMRYCNTRYRILDWILDSIVSDIWYLCFSVFRILLQKIGAFIVSSKLDFRTVFHPKSRKFFHLVAMYRSVKICIRFFHSYGIWYLLYIRWFLLKLWTAFWSTRENKQCCRRYWFSIDVTVYNFKFLSSVILTTLFLCDTPDNSSKFAHFWGISISTWIGEKKTINVFCTRYSPYQLHNSMKIQVSNCRISNL